MVQLDKKINNPVSCFPINGESHHFTMGMTLHCEVRALVIRSGHHHIKG